MLKEIFTLLLFKGGSDSDMMLIV